MLDILYPPLYKLVWLLAFVLKGFFPKLKKGFELRKSVDGVAPWLQYPKNTQPIWIHAPSGEFEYAIPLIREIKKREPSTKILFTYYTGSYLHRVSKEPLLDFYCPLPWDTHSALSEFIEHHNPKMLLIAQTGFWPKLLEECARHNVPTAAFSMTFNKNLSGFKARFYQWLFRHLNHFYVVDEADKKSLERLELPGAITVMGDTRYDQCLYRLSQDSFIKVARDLLPKKVFVSASTWPEDETVLLPYIREHRDEAHWIVVPHEIDKDHIESLQNALGDVPSYLYSKIQTWNGEGVLIVDEFGVLATLYKMADGAFIGGSFRGRIHSVMESLACGNLTFVGPYHLTNREALSFATFDKTSIAPVQKWLDAASVSNLLPQLKKWQPSDRETLKKAFLAQAGASARLATVLL